MLTRFGERIGVAFQLSDDLLDVAQRQRPSPARRPAPTCARASRRCRCCYALRDARPGGRPAARAAGAGLTDDAEHAEALALLRAHPAMAAARAEVARWADEARDGLAPLPDVPAKAALAALCDQVVGRTA